MAGFGRSPYHSPEASRDHPCETSELRPGLMAYVIARVARNWETVLPGGTIPINGDLLLVDDRGGSIEVVIPHDCMHRFSSDKVVEGNVYKILHFKVLDLKKKYKSIPAEFADMNEIRERSEKDPIFTDVIGMFVGYGELVAISVDSGTRMSDKVDVNLRLLSDEIHRVSFWVSHISHLNLAEFAAMPWKPIFVVAGTTVIVYSVTKFLSSSSATKVYVDPDIPEAEEIRQRFKNDLAHVQLLAPEHTSQSLASANAKDAVIFNLLYLTLEKAQGQKFRVEAEVTELDTTNGWMQLTLMIKDDTADLEVAVFGPLAKNLIGVNLANEVAERTVDPNKLPACAKDIIGSQFIFILGVSDQTVKRGWRKFKVFAYTEKQVRQPLPPSVKGKQILGSTSHPVLRISTNVIDPTMVNQDSQTCPDSPLIPADLFVDSSPLKKIKQEESPIEKKGEQQTPSDCHT
ncbi:Nucleic acid-binding protein [Corchorus olitorius]|uniref:Nucleic acid-binding protein n=1 Tax=Corchorus olitorius TaxID=93759 RepID=A0A1R3KNY1_9ROSI|nr:Nucleic acid-binding protein [Corchorus olitorius]